MIEGEVSVSDATDASADRVRLELQAQLGDKFGEVGLALVDGSHFKLDVWWIVVNALQAVNLIGKIKSKFLSQQICV